MFRSKYSTFLEIVKIGNDTPRMCAGQPCDPRANYGMYFYVDKHTWTFFTTMSVVKTYVRSNSWY